MVDILNLTRGLVYYIYDAEPISRWAGGDIGAFELPIIYFQDDHK